MVTHKGDGEPTPWYVWSAVAALLLGLTGVALGAGPPTLGLPVVGLVLAFLAWS